MSYRPSSSEDVYNPGGPVHTAGEVLQQISRVLVKRAERRVKPHEEWLNMMGLTSIFLGGGALLQGQPADLDFFPDPEHRSAFLSAMQQIRRLNDIPQWKSKRVVSLPNSIQLIDYVAPDLTLNEKKLAWYHGIPAALVNLVEDFDFAHCGVAARLARSQTSGWSCTSVCYTPDFIASRVTGGTYYTGGHRPLGSLGRVAKVALKLGLSSADAHELGCQVVAHMTAKGPISLNEALRDEWET